ncbi:NlpC/P60 family protein [Propionibacteriaceae bacterium G1746]|uniref:C40 family peptidase n=1 Tax=Aestuariimicrobium sp. G57 TaxID=3418485 RepID=UPI003C28E340
MKLRNLLNAGTGAVVAIGLAVGLAVMPTSAVANPDAVKETQEKVAQLQEENSKIDLEYAKLSEALDQAGKKVASLNTDIASQQTVVDGLTRSMGQLALVQYQNSGLNLTAKLLASEDDGQLLNQLSSVQSFTARTNGKLQQMQGEQATLKTYKDQLVATQAKIQADKAKQSDLQKTYQTKLVEAEKLLAKLTSEEQARLKKLQQEEAARQLAATQAADAATEATTNNSGATTTPKTPKSPAKPKATPETPAASGGAARAVAFAKAQIGKSYVLGATGPYSYDCSGLTGAAWRAAGVSLPRTSQGQASAGVRVSLANIQPGDIVVFYSGASHVGIYVGGGMIVDAANPRAGVRMISLQNSWMPIHSIRRVG